MNNNWTFRDDSIWTVHDAYDKVSFSKDNIIINKSPTTVLKSALAFGMIATSLSAPEDAKVHFHLDSKLAIFTESISTNITNTYEFVEGKGFVMNMFYEKVKKDDYTKDMSELELRLNAIETSVKNIESKMITSENILRSFFKSFGAKVSAFIITISGLLSLIKIILEIVAMFSKQ